MYHVELRQFPHNFCRFNLTGQELHEAILDAWAREEWIDLGERKWDPHQAKLTILEGPELPLEQLSMGRGWRNAKRHSEDVTEHMIVAAREIDAPSSSPSAGTRSTVGQAVDGETLATDLLGLLGDDPIPLMRAWQLALDSHPDRTPSECLALAESFVGR